MNNNIPTILSVAGSDPSGGAGIQADLKTLASVGVYGAAAITCITVQNSKGVEKVEPLSPELVEQQLKAVLVDHNVTHIKIGMVGTASIAHVISDILGSFKGEKVYDPVLASTAGQELSEPDFVHSVQSSLLPQITVLTPNRFELETISGVSCLSKEQMLESAQKIMEKFPNIRVVIVKGGHFQEGMKKITDIMLSRDGSKIHDTRDRHSSLHLHGTGCTYASAFCGYHSLTKSYQQAFHLSGRYMDRLISTSTKYRVVNNSQNGPLLHHLTTQVKKTD